MGCSFVAGIQSALGSATGLSAEQVIPVVAGAFLGPAAGSLLGTSAAVGAAAAGAATGAIGAAATGGNILSGAVTGGIGGYAGGALGGALGLGGSAAGTTAAAAGGTVGDMASIYQNAYGMSAADAMAAAESAMASGVMPGQLAATVADAGLLTGAQIASLTGNAALGSSSLLADASNILGNVPSIPSGTGGSGSSTNSLSSFLKDPSWGGAGNLIADNLGNLTNTGLGLYSQYQAGQTAKDIASQNAALQKPWLDAGTNALAQITPGIQPGGEFRKDYTVADYQQDPYNKWLQSQGTQAITRSAAAKGSLGSGNVLAELSKYNQNVAGAGFADQWNREQTGTANKFNRLASVANLGQQAPANVMAGNAFAASESSKARTGMTNTLSNLINSNWQGA